MTNNSLLKIISLLPLFLMLSCAPEQKGFKVAATPVPHAQMLEYIKPDLKAQGIDLVVVVTDDYNIANRALANSEVEANFFQHTPFMQEQIAQFHYPIESIAKIEIEPMGIYSKKISALAELKEKATIAIPNDPTNEARALFLLQKEGIIEMQDPNNSKATILNIVKNPKNIRFIEVDAAMLPRSLEEVDAAVINANFALEANLNPLKDALATESPDSPYANILAIRIGDEEVPEIIALKKAMTSEKMREFILNTYHGAIIPAF